LLIITPDGSCGYKVVPNASVGRTSSVISQHLFRVIFHTNVSI